MILEETYSLTGNISIPKLGLGTWFIDDDKAAEAVRAAVKLGYRLIDTGFLSAVDYSHSADSAYRLLFCSVMLYLSFAFLLMFYALFCFRRFFSIKIVS